MRGAKMGPLAIGDSRFVRTDFTRASLRGADLRGAHAPRARFLEAQMDGCDLPAPSWKSDVLIAPRLGELSASRAEGVIYGR